MIYISIHFVGNAKLSLSKYDKSAADVRNVSIFTVTPGNCEIQM